MPSGFKSDRRLYLTADKSRVVEEGDKDAAWLFASVGCVIPGAEAHGLKYRDGKVILPKARAEPKSGKKPEDKSLKKGGDKTAPSARPPDSENP